VRVGSSRKAKAIGRYCIKPVCPGDRPIASRSKLSAAEWVTIGRRAHDPFGGDITARARPTFDHELLA
jgi:hypothetical protein